MKRSEVGPREALIIGARAWKAEAELATHRNLCPQCRPPSLKDPGDGSLCAEGQQLLATAERAKSVMMDTAELLGVKVLTIM